MIVPYSHSEAQEMCSRFQYLKGMPFGNGEHAVEAIVVTPFDANFRQRFFLYYLLFDGNAEEALQDYKGMLFEISVVGRNSLDEIIHDSLASWLAQNETTRAAIITSSTSLDHTCI